MPEIVRRFQSTQGVRIHIAEVEACPVQLSGQFIRCSGEEPRLLEENRGGLNDRLSVLVLIYLEFRCKSCRGDRMMLSHCIAYKNYSSNDVASRDDLLAFSVIRADRAARALAEIAEVRLAIEDSEGRVNSRRLCGQPSAQSQRLLVLPRSARLRRATPQARAMTLTSFGSADDRDLRECLRCNWLCAVPWS